MAIVILIGGALAILSVLVALMVLSLWVADKLEARRHRYTDLTTFQQAMERIMTREQP